MGAEGCGCGTYRWALRYKVMRGLISAAAVIYYWQLHGSAVVCLPKQKEMGFSPSQTSDTLVMSSPHRKTLMLSPCLVHHSMAEKGNLSQNEGKRVKWYQAMGALHFSKSSTKLASVMVYASLLHTVSGSRWISVFLSVSPCVSFHLFPNVAFFHYSVFYSSSSLSPPHFQHPSILASLSLSLSPSPPPSLFPPFIDAWWLIPATVCPWTHSSTHSPLPPLPLRSPFPFSPHAIFKLSDSHACSPVQLPRSVSLSPSPYVSL